MSRTSRPRFFGVLLAFALVGCGPAGGSSPPGLWLCGSGGSHRGDGASIVGDGGAALLVFDTSDLSRAPRQIKVPNAQAFGAWWSPDGSRLAFSLVSASGRLPDIATIATDGTDLQILTTDPAKEEFPAWGLPTP